MSEMKQIVENYLQKLETQLNNLSPVERKNQVEEVKDHLTSFIKDYQAKGLTVAEIQQKIQEEFMSPEEISEQILNNDQPTKTIYKVAFIIAIGLTIIASTLLPAFKTVPLSILLFALAYFIYSKKVIWGFAIARKANGQIKNRDKVANLGALYIFLVGVVILLTEFIKPLRSDVTFWVLLVGYVAYSGYVARNTVR